MIAEDVKVEEHGGNDKSPGQDDPDEVNVEDLLASVEKLMSVFLAPDLATTQHLNQTVCAVDERTFFDQHISADDGNGNKYCELPMDGVAVTGDDAVGRQRESNVEGEEEDIILTGMD